MQHVSKWASAAKVALALVLTIGFVPIVPTTAYATANEKGGGSSETVTKEGTNSISDDKQQGNENVGGESAVETQGSAGHKDTADGTGADNSGTGDNSVSSSGTDGNGAGNAGNAGTGSGSADNGSTGNSGAGHNGSNGSGASDSGIGGSTGSSTDNGEGESAKASAADKSSPNSLANNQSESSETESTGSQNESDGETTDTSGEEYPSTPYEALDVQIQAVLAVLANVVISNDDGYTDVNGNKVTSDQLWIDQENYNILNDALTKAQAIYNDKTLSDEEYQNAADELKSIAIVHGVQFGKLVSEDTIDQIKSSLFISESYLNIYYASEDGSDLTDNKWWVTPDLYNALEDAHEQLLDLFNSIKADENVLQSACDNWLAEWSVACDDFFNNLKRGLLEPESYVDQLESAIYDHQAVLQALVDEAYHLCEEGDDGSDVPSDEWWYPKSAVDAYEKVIDDVWGIALNNDNLTEQEMLDAIAMLDAAYENFPEAQLGKRVSEETIIQMGYALELAEYFLDNTKKGESSKDAFSNEFWVTEPIHDELDINRGIVRLLYDAALEEGNSVSQDSCDEALEALGYAFEAFTDNMQRGELSPTTPYGTLQSALLDHQILLEGLLGMAHVCQDEGAHVPSDEFWLPYDAIQNYENTIIQVTQFCEENNESITEEQAKEQIAKLEQAYDDVPEMASGSRVSQDTLEKMELSIEVAQRVLNALHISNDNGAQLPSTELWVTQEEYDQIAALIENVRSLYEAGSAEYNTVPQTDCDAVLDALSEATNTLPKKGTMKASEEPTDETTAENTSSAVKQASLDNTNAAKSELAKTADYSGIGAIAFVGGAVIALLVGAYAIRRFRSSK